MAAIITCLESWRECTYKSILRCNSVVGLGEYVSILVSKADLTTETKQRKTNPELEIWANAQRDGRPAEHRWSPLFNAPKFG